jgi:hypothetical protein
MKNRLPFFIFVSIVIILPTLVNAGSDISNLNITVQPEKINANMGDTITFTGIVENNGNTVVNGLRVYLSTLRVTDGKEMTMSPEDWNVFDVAPIENLSPGKSTSYNWSMLLIDSGEYKVYLTMVDKNENQAVMSRMSELIIKKAQKLNPNNVVPVVLGVPISVIIIILSLRFIRRKKLRKDS